MAGRCRTVGVGVGWLVTELWAVVQDGSVQWGTRSEVAWHMERSRDAREVGDVRCLPREED